MNTTIKKLIIYLFVLCDCYYDAWGQIITADYTIFYTFSYITDTSTKAPPISESYILFRKGHSSYFYNLNLYRFDSIVYDHEQKYGLVTPENFDFYQKVVGPNIPKFESNLRVIKNFNEQSAKIILPQAGFYKYMEQPLSLEWTMLDGTDTIHGVPCHKATTHYGGRHYTAWFAEHIAINDGPYIFTGLPGLILKLVDDEAMYSFETYGISLNPEQRLLKKDLLNTSVQVLLSREKYIQEIHDMKENPKFPAGVSGVSPEMLVRMKNAYKKRFDLLLEWK